MSEEATGFFGQQLHIEDVFPFDWSYVTEPVSGEFAGTHPNNEKTLKQVIELDEFSHDHKEELYSTKENARLDKKLNLMIDMLGAMVAMYRKTPSDAAVKIYSQGLVWQEKGANIPSMDDEIVIHMYLHAYCPYPVIFEGRIVSVHPSEDGAWCSLAYNELTELVVDLLEKLIFQRHRRAVASRKGDVT